MPRPLRIEFEGAWHLVENKAAGKTKIYRENEDYDRFLELLEEISSMFGIEIYGYSLLNDQYTLLLRDPQAQLSRAMRHLNGVYTQYHHQTWHSDGSIFGSRFKSLVIDPDAFLTDALIYTHYKPVDAGICAKSADHAYTSHRAYLKDRDKPSWLHIDKILKPMGFLKTFAIAKLSKLVSMGPSDEFLNELAQERSILGRDSFKTTILKSSAKAPKTSSKNHKSNDLAAKEIMDVIASTYKVPTQQLKKSSSGIKNEARNMAIYQLRSVAGLPQSQIAKILNASNGYTVAKNLQRFHTQMQEDDGLAQRAKAIAKTVQQQLRQ